MVTEKASSSPHSSFSEISSVDSAVGQQTLTGSSIPGRYYKMCGHQLLYYYANICITVYFFF